MGTEYYLVREDNNTLFELGKGLVNEAFDYLEEGAAPLPATIPLAALIAQALNKYDWSEEDGADPSYAAFVAAQAVTWADGKPVRFCNEHEIESFKEEPPITGSRYYEEVEG